jgi:hypothetical protein
MKIEISEEINTSIRGLARGAGTLLGKKCLKGYTVLKKTIHRIKDFLCRWAPPLGNF